MAGRRLSERGLRSSPCAGGVCLEFCPCGVLGVAHEVAVVPVDDLHARAHEPSEFKHRDTRSEAPRGEGVSQVVDAMSGRSGVATRLLTSVLAADAPCSVVV